MPQLDGFSAKPLLLLMLVTPALTFITTYAISASNGTLPYPYYFLSVSIESKPASCIGSFGLSLTSLLAPVLAFIRYTYVKMHISGNLSGADATKAQLLNTRALRFAVLSGLAGHGVASFQSKTDDKNGSFLWVVVVHLLFALVFFSGGGLYCFYSHYIDRMCPQLGTVPERRLRRLFTYASQLQLVFMVFVLPLLYYLTKGAPEVVVVMSVFEISLLCTFMSTYLTFLKEMEGLSVRLVVLLDERAYSIHEHKGERPLIKQGEEEGTNEMGSKSMV